MAEVSPATATVKSKTKTSPAPGAAPFENAFAHGTFEAPAAFREFAEKGLSQAKDNYEKMRSAAQEASSLMEVAYSSASKGATDYGLKLIEAARANSNAAFDYASELAGAKSLSEVVELTTSHTRRQFEAMTAQIRDLTSLAQKVVAETAEPLKDGVTRMAKKVA